MEQVTESVRGLISEVTERYAEVVFRLRDLGIAFSDRRAVKGLKLVSASAVLCGRDKALKVWTYDGEFRTTWRRPDGTAIPLATK